MRRNVLLLPVVFLLAIPLLATDPKPAPETLKAWDRYIGLTEKRIQSDLSTPTAILRSDIALLKNKKIYVEQLETKDEKGKEIEVKGGSFHHWLGAVYIPGKDVATVIRWVQDYGQYQDYFKDVEQSSLRSHGGNEYKIFLRLRRSKFSVTARFNTEHTVVYSSRKF